MCNGGYSQIECELRLLKSAIQSKKYDYFHLISGQDLPLKANNEIDAFFESNKGDEFVRIQAPIFKFEDRIKYYYLIQKNMRNRYINIINHMCVKLQKIFKITRNKNVEF